MNRVISGFRNIHHRARIIKGVARLYMSDDMSDITFVVDGETLPAHRVILGAHSEYFRAMLYGNLLEATQNKIHLKEVPLGAFKLLLKYIYTGCMSLARIDEEDLLDTLKLANMYGFVDLVAAISSYLIEVMTLDNVIAILESASWDMEELITACYDFLDDNAEAILQHGTFKNLSEDTVCNILKRDTFYAPEVNIFRAVQDWLIRNDCGRAADNVISRVRFILMTQEQLLGEVRSSGLLSEANLQNVITEMITSTQIQYRAVILPKQNVVCNKFRCEIIRGENPAVLLEPKISYIDPKIHASWHELSDPQGIVVQLDKVYIINHIKLLLSDLDDRSYCYYVEVSGNQSNWDRVVDHRDYHCRSKQFMYFPQQPVRYIRLVGTHNTVDQQFYVVELEAMFVEEAVPVVNGILAPTYNVADRQLGAAQMEGYVNYGDFGQLLLSGACESDDYDSDSGFVYHGIGDDDEKKIVVQLGQPYWIGSLSLLLMDRGDRAFSFYIETSTNGKDWVMLVDKRNELLRSWQHFTFESRVIVFIRLVGTKATAFWRFECVHFECPSQPHDFGKSTEGLVSSSVE